MSEYQRYEFMTVDRPLTREQLKKVNGLSSHIEASPTYAEIEYHWGDFKHDPFKVLYKFFDGFLYWSNWGSPQFGLRFPHGVLTDDLLRDYDCDDMVVFSQHEDYDILAFDFGHLEAPDGWIDYDLESLISIRQELMEGDFRTLYIGWLVAQPVLNDHGPGTHNGSRFDYNGDEDEEEDEDYDEDDEEDYDGEDGHGAVNPYFHKNKNKNREDEGVIVPEVPPGMGKLTEAQQALAGLLRVPQELLAVVAQHSSAILTTPAQLSEDKIVAQVEQLSQKRRSDYLVRLARNEPGLQRKLLKELGELNQDKTQTTTSSKERVTFQQLYAEGEAIKAEQQRQRAEQQRLRREEEQRAYLRHLQDVHEHPERHWERIQQAVTHLPAGSRYDEAVRLLVELRDTADQYNEREQFQALFQQWIQLYLRRTSLLDRLTKHGFSWTKEKKA